MIKTVGALRDELDDAHHDMPLRMMTNRGVLIGVSEVQWLDGKCVLVGSKLGIRRE